MSFREFKYGEVPDASDCNDNYYWIGQGSRLPIGGILLNYSTGAYDLGNETYMWGDAYINSIANDYLNSEGITWELVSRVDVETDTSRIEITGLNSSIDNQITIIYMLKGTTSTVIGFELYANAASAGAAWLLNRINVNSVTMDETATSYSILGVTTDATTTSLYTFGVVEIDVYKSTDVRNRMGNVMCLVGSGENRVDEVQITWIRAGTNNTITSLQIIPDAGEILIGSFIEVWRKGV